jgi:hypothetical protein
VVAKSPCQKAFDDGAADRLKYPLRSGGYKLNERRWKLARCEETIEAINKLIVHQRSGVRGPPLPLGLCTTDDAGLWLKRLPQQIAYDLAYDILPAIDALAEEGYPPHEVAAARRKAEAEAKVLFADCEAAHDLLKKGVRYEYRRMKAGHSTLRPLFERAISIARTAQASVGDVR